MWKKGNADWLILKDHSFTSSRNTGKTDWHIIDVYWYLQACHLSANVTMNASTGINLHNKMAVGSNLKLGHAKLQKMSKLPCFSFTCTKWQCSHRHVKSQKVVTFCKFYRRSIFFLLFEISVG